MYLFLQGLRLYIINVCKLEVIMLDFLDRCVHYINYYENSGKKFSDRGQTVIYDDVIGYLEGMLEEEYSKSNIYFICFNDCPIFHQLAITKDKAFIRLSDERDFEQIRSDQPDFIEKMDELIVDVVLAYGNTDLIDFIRNIYARIRIN